MGAFFTAASSQKLAASSVPVTALPFTFGGWVNPASALSGSSRAWFYLGNPGTSDYYIGYWSSGLTTLAIQTANVTLGGTADSGVAPTVGAWHYVLGRFISSTNRRISVMTAAGTVSHGADTTSGADPATTPTQMTLGCRDLSTPDLFWDGSAAEFFIADVDLWPDGGAAPDWWVRLLAYRGPLALPGRTRNIMEYRALRGTMEASRIGDTWNGPKGRVLWTQTNGVRLGSHPVLMGGYKTSPGVRVLAPIPF
jgi:hypothetical protein